MCYQAAREKNDDTDIAAVEKLNTTFYCIPSVLKRNDQSKMALIVIISKSDVLA